MNSQESRISIPVLLLALGCVILSAAVVTVLVRQFYPSIFATWFALSEIPMKQSDAPASATTQRSSTHLVADIDFEEIDRLIRSLPPETQAQVLGDAAAFADMVKREVARRSVLQTALEARLADDEQIAYLERRAAEQVLINSYVRIYTKADIPDDYPNNDQIQTFYDKNQADFTVGERVALWQVFIPVPADSDSAVVAQLEKSATELATKIRDDKMSFTDAALAYTGHEASRLQGGFVGLLNVSQLVPEVKDALPELTEGEVSEPIRGKDGFHIIRRGPLIHAQILPLAQVSEAIRNQLRQAGQRNSQQAMLASTQERFGKDLSEQVVEEWRLRLNRQN